MTSKIVVNNIESDSGISSVTFNSNIQIGSGTTIHSSGIDLGTGNLKGHNLESTGIITATTFVGNLTGNPTGSGANLTNIPAANITGTLPAIDGSNLTGVGVGTADNINTSGIVTATALVGDFAPRNMIINGAMQINARANGTLTSNSSTGQYPCDRWVSRGEGGSKAFTIQQISIASAGQGVRHALKVTSSQAASVGSHDIFNVRQMIEGYNIQRLNLGEAGCSSMTLSFTAYSSVAGTHSGAIQNSAQNRSYPFTYTLVANTWTDVKITIPPITSGSFNETNGVGLRVVFDMGSGSAFRGTANQWNSAQDEGATGAVRILETNGATWYVTKVQLEEGTVATKFEKKLFSDELVQCQRYFQKRVDTDGVYFGMGYMYDHYRGYCPVTHYVTMRTAPSMQTVTGSNYYSLHRNGSGDNFDGFTNWFSADENHGTLQTVSGLSGTGGHAGQYWSNNAACKITFSAEL